MEAANVNVQRVHVGHVSMTHVISQHVVWRTESPDVGRFCESDCLVGWMTTHHLLSVCQWLPLNALKACIGGRVERRRETDWKAESLCRFLRFYSETWAGSPL